MSITPDAFQLEQLDVTGAIWRLDFDGLKRRQRKLAALLSHDERERMRRLAGDAKLRFLAGRVLVRLELGKRLSMNPHDVPLGVTRWGKPRPSPDCGDLSFNLTHSGNHVVLALSRRPVGIDVETSGRSPQSVIQRFHPDEQAALARLRGSARREQFGRLWAAKEACMKCRGYGSISAVQVTLEQQGRWRDIAWHRIEPIQGVHGVVAVQGD